MAKQHLLLVLRRLCLNSLSSSFTCVETNPLPLRENSQCTLMYISHPAIRLKKIYQRLGWHQHRTTIFTVVFTIQYHRYAAVASDIKRLLLIRQQRYSTTVAHLYFTP